MPQAYFYIFQASFNNKKTRKGDIKEIFCSYKKNVEKVKKVGTLTSDKK